MALQPTGVAQIGHYWPLFDTGLQRPTDLGQHDYRYPKLAGKLLERQGDLADIFRTRGIGVLP